MTTVTSFNPFSAEVKADPYPYYAWLRREAPAYYNADLGFWTISRYADVAAILRNPADFSSAEGIGPEKTPGIPMIITMDPPNHTRIRSLVSKAFTPRVVAQNAVRVQAIMDGLLDDVLTKGTFDLVQDVAYPLPVIVIAEMLGVEPQRRDDFKRWSDDVIGSLAGTAHGHDQASMQRSMGEFAAYFYGIVEARRAERKGDLVSALIAAQEDRDALNTGEIIAFCLLLLVAGNETTTNLISNGALALTQNPEQAARLRADASLAPSFVEEALRYDSPIQGFFRVTTRAVQVSGSTIPKGEKVFVLYAAANRDDAQFPDADRFMIDRTPNNHVAFGLGVHFCLGAPLARLEARIATETIFRRLKNLRPDPSGTITRVDNPLLRGLKSFPLLYEPA